MATEPVLATELVLRRISVDEYHQMAEAGILGEDDRIELIDGKIVEMSPIGGRHVNCVARLNYLLVTHFGRDAAVHVQSPVRISADDEPEPDFAVVRMRDYGSELPDLRDVLLLIEVADSSVLIDRRVKFRQYARAGIPEYWVVDLPGGVVECYADPAGEDFRAHRAYERAESIESFTIPGLVVPVDEILD